MANERDQTRGMNDSDNSQAKRSLNDLKEERGGPQADQRVGEKEKGSHNQEAKGRNPQGNKAEP